MNMKLTTLLNQNGKLVNNDRLKRLTKKVKQDKKKIMGLAETYNSKYKTEIIEGTKKRQLLIAAGEKEGLTEAQVIGSSGFLPTLSTPILNWLFFFMNEHKDSMQDDERKQLNEQVGHMTHKEVDVMENTPELFEYLYGNITMGTFSKLKKLKRLSKSPNENEAFRAYRKCLKLCEQYNVEFDKIPTG